MKNRMKLYIGLLVAALAVVGTGVGLSVARPAKLNIPSTPPIVSVEAYYRMDGYKDQLFVYQDGTVIRIEDTGLRLPSPGHPATRTWSKGVLNKAELSDLATLVTSNETSKLEDSCYFLGNPSSDLSYTLIVNAAGSDKAIRASNYLSPDKGVTQPDMPHPLDEIYARLHSIALKTREFARQAMQD